jgi:transposase
MARQLLPDDLWALIAPLIPPARPRPKGGRRPVAPRDALRGILFVLHTGIPWEYLPHEVSHCCGMTCWRRLHEWQQAGVWLRIHQAMLDRLGAADGIDWERAAVDAASVPAKKGASTPARTRPIAAKPARNGILPWMLKASRSSWTSPPPTSTTAPG